MLVGMRDSERIAAIHDFWFGPLDADGMPEQERHGLWFGASDTTDTEIGARFGTDVAAALEGRYDHWYDAGGGIVALALLLDQFTRNIYRGTPAAFSGDEAALALARRAVNDGIDRGLPTIHRVFLYIPFEHAENLSDQDEGIACFDRLLKDAPEGARDRLEGFRRYMVAHREVIAEFGRFPHRNPVLGRESSPEEQEHLKTRGGF